MSDFSLLITDWYRLNYRNLPWRETKDPYLIWISEIILQQTRVDQGKNYYEKFKRNYPTVHDLARASEQEVLRDWQGLGYYSRARNLHASAQEISTKMKGHFPTCYDDIIKLKGVGSYTAAAISSIAFNEKQAVVDGNVYRVLSRVFDIETPIDSSTGKKQFQKLADELIIDEYPGEHNQAVMELGALICKPKSPECNICPLNGKCLALSNKTIDQRPIKVKKVKTRERYFQFLIFSNGESTVIEKRDDKDNQPITDLNPPCEMNHYVQDGFYGHPYIVGIRLPRYEYMDRPDIVELAAKTIPPAWCAGGHWRLLAHGCQ